LHLAFEAEADAVEAVVVAYGAYVVVVVVHGVTWPVGVGVAVAVGTAVVVVGVLAAVFENIPMMMMILRHPPQLLTILGVVFQCDSCDARPRRRPCC
jgi:hypothetical protein